MTLWQKIRCVLGLAKKRFRGYQVYRKDYRGQWLPVGLYPVHEVNDALNMANEQLMADFFQSQSRGALTVNLMAKPVFEVVERSAEAT